VSALERSTTQTAQIRLTLTSQINSGLLQAGMKLPSERELSELFGTTRITIKEALLSLEAEGRLYCEDRRGWFVAPPRLVYNPMYRSHFHEMVERQQRQASTRVLSVRHIVAPPALCQELELPALSRLFQIRRVRSLDGRVVMFVEHHLKPERFPGILELDVSQSLTGVYRDHYGIRYGRSRFDIVSTAASGDVAQALTLGEGSPVLLVSRVNYDQHGAIIDCDHEYWRHDAVRISVDSRPE
jgi:DNA-binding GntR family transcriptional regulator